MRNILALLALLPLPALAQAEFYNLDDDRPTLIEDAYPTEYGGLELQAGLGRLEVAPGERSVLFHAEINYGLYYNLQVGAAGRALVGEVTGLTQQGFSDTSVFALYNVNRESRYWPALALRVDVGLPTGAFSASGVRAVFKGLATRTFGHVRLHANAAYGAGAAPKQTLHSDLAARFWAGAAADYPLTPNFLVVGEAYVLRVAGETDLNVNALLGLRWQVSPRCVLDAGLGRGLLSGGNQLTATVGLTFSPGAIGI
jgi:hypothetical protein